MYADDYFEECIKQPILQETPNKTEQNSKDQAKSTLEMFREAMEGTNFKSEEEKVAYEAKLNEKIKRGDKLSQREMSYLQRTNPIMYFRIKRVQVQRELLEKRLKQCRSKKEVEEAKRRKEQREAVNCHKIMKKISTFDMSI